MTRLRGMPAWLLILCWAGNALGLELYDIAPATPPRTLAASYFGTHLHRLVPSPESPLRVTPWPAGEIGALRLWDTATRWADLEPERGAWRFDRLDAYVAQALSNRASVVMVLGSPPRWAAARPAEPGPYGPGSASEPAQMEDWERYVAALARRYKGRIAAYELWNEPYFSDLPADRGNPQAFFSGSVASMVEMARRARTVLAREDPQAALWTPGFVGAAQRMDMFLRAGGGRYVDAVAYHFYADDERGFLELHRDVRAVMARHGLDLPLYNTESGFAVGSDDIRGDGSSPSRAHAAALLARSLVLGAYLGIERYYQYAWDNGRSGMLMPATLEATPSAAAFAAVRRWLIGTTLLGCQRASPGTVRCEGSRNGDRLAIVWQASETGRAVLRFPAGMQVLSAERAVERHRPIDLQALSSDGLEIDADPVAVWWRAPQPASGPKP